jgi:transcriptional regulator with XRE-family HTH domain
LKETKKKEEIKPNRRAGDDLLGARIRQLRLDQGVIAADLAARAGVSASFLSQIERGASSPSLRIVQKLSNQLGVSVSALLEGDAGDVAPALRPACEVVRADARKVMRRASGPEYQLLSPDLRGHIEFILVELPANESSLITEHEGEEQVVVVSGRVVLEVNGDEFELRAGDAARIDPGLPHRTVNRGRRPAVYICAMTPPSF